jgi:hypothetical protein
MLQLTDLIELQDPADAREVKALLRDTDLDNRGTVKDEARSHRANTATSNRMTE